MWDRKHRRAGAGAADERDAAILRRAVERMDAGDEWSTAVAEATREVYDGTSSAPCERAPVAPGKTTRTSALPAASPTPDGENPPPTARALLLLKGFSPRRTTGRGCYERSGGGIFEAAYDAPGAQTDVVRVKKLGTPWTITFVSQQTMVGDTEILSTFVREAQDGTQIVNYYERELVSNIAISYLVVDEAIFAPEAAQYAYGTSPFETFSKKIDDWLSSTPAAPVPLFSILLSGPRDAVFIARGEGLKHDLKQRGGSRIRVHLELGNESDAHLLWITRSEVSP